MNETDTTWLIVVFGTNPSVALTRQDPQTGFRRGSIYYEGLVVDGLGSCYDRLLDSRNTFVGIRIWPVDDIVKPLLAALDLAYVVNDPREPFVDVYLDGRRGGAISGDEQAFGGQFFQSFGGELAVAFDLTYLAQSGSDVLAAKQFTADWFEPQI